MPKQQAPCCVYDFTIKQECDDPSPADIEEVAGDLMAHLDLIAKKFALQLERGASGYVHWQGRCSLKEKVRLDQAIQLFHKNVEPTTHVSLTTTQNHRNDFYVMKPETRYMARGQISAETSRKQNKKLF